MDPSLADGPRRSQCVSQMTSDESKVPRALRDTNESFWTRTRRRLRKKSSNAQGLRSCTLCYHIISHLLENCGKSLLYSMYRSYLYLTHPLVQIPVKTGAVEFVQPGWSCKWQVQGGFDVDEHRFIIHGCQDQTPRSLTLRLAQSREPRHFGVSPGTKRKEKGTKQQKEPERRTGAVRLPTPGVTRTSAAQLARPCHATRTSPALTRSPRARRCPWTLCNQARKLVVARTA